MEYVVYKLTHRASGSFYIGATKSLRRRILTHTASSKAACKKSRLHALMAVDGLAAFDVEVIAKCASTEALKAKELQVIQSLSPDLNSCLTHAYLPQRWVRSWDGQSLRTV